MALVDRALRAEELGEDCHGSCTEPGIRFVSFRQHRATGFVEHLKLPHYVDFQSELQNVRRLRESGGAAGGAE